jgi:hypothetical protein
MTKYNTKFLTEDLFKFIYYVCGLVFLAQFSIFGSYTNVNWAENRTSIKYPNTANVNSVAYKTNIITCTFIIII